MKTPDPATIQVMTAAMSGLTTVFVGLAIWAVKRWIARTDQRLEALALAVADLRTKGAVSQERFNHLMGGIDVLKGSVQLTDQATGRLKASVDKIWTILQLKGIAQSQASDLGKTGEG